MSNSLTPERVDTIRKVWASADPWPRDGNGTRHHIFNVVVPKKAPTMATAMVAPLEADFSMDVLTFRYEETLDRLAYRITCEGLTVEDGRL